MSLSLATPAQTTTAASAPPPLRNCAAQIRLATVPQRQPPPRNTQLRYCTPHVATARRNSAQPLATPRRCHQGQRHGLLQHRAALMQAKHQWARRPQRLRRSARRRYQAVRQHPAPSAATRRTRQPCRGGVPCAAQRQEAHCAGRKAQHQPRDDQAWRRGRSPAATSKASRGAEIACGSSRRTVHTTSIGRESTIDARRCRRQGAQVPLQRAPKPTAP